MTRLRDIQIIEDMTSLRTDVDTLRAAQMLGGDSLLGYLTNSANLNDYSFPIAVGTNKNFLLTFTPTNNAFPAIVDLFFFYSIGQPDVMTYAVAPWAAAVVNMSIQKYPPTSTSSQWYMTFQDSDGTGAPYTVYLKYIFSATDTGTWSIVAV
jgi:hypothetical protein